MTTIRSFEMEVKIYCGTLFLPTMPWRETWRHQERPDADQIPEEYGLLADRSNSIVFGYFTGVIGLAYVLLATVGTRPTLVAGVPVLQWLLVAIAVLIVFGLYLAVHRQQSDTTSMDVAPMGEEAE